MNKVTYLIGAGASANALPVVNGIPEKMAEMRNKFDGISFSNREFFSFDTLKECNKQECKNIFLADLDKIRLAIEDHASADTYAKKLFLQNDTEGLVRLKLMLSILFSIAQSRHAGVDKRYDAFFASILNRLDEFPTNLRILSWNYDQQFEMGYARFSKRGLEDAHQTLRVQFKHLGKSLHNNYNADKFSIIKLNGSTGLVGDNRNYRSLLSDYRVSKEQNNEIDPNEGFRYNSNQAEYLLCKYHEMLYPFRKNQNPDMEPLMSFAWEDEFFDSNHIKTKAVESCIKANTLVVIGYSFPYFNRETDKMLFDNMRSLKKIYIQDKYPQDVKDRILTLMPTEKSPENQKISPLPEFVFITNLDQFVIPHEL